MTPDAADVHTGTINAFSLTCPYDGQPMESVSAAGITVDRCTSCRSLWLDVKEFERLSSIKRLTDVIDAPSSPDPVVRSKPSPATTPPATAQADKPKVVLCPRDHTRLIEMVHRRQAHLTYHSCKMCGGMLLDAGELRDLGQFTLLERVKAFFRLK